MTDREFEEAIIEQRVKPADAHFDNFVEMIDEDVRPFVDSHRKSFRAAFRAGYYMGLTDASAERIPH